MHRHGSDGKPAESGSPDQKPSLVRRVLMTPLYVLLLTFLWGFSFAQYADGPLDRYRLFYYGLAVCVGLGISMGISGRLKEAVLLFVVGVIALVPFFWIISLVFEWVLLEFGVPPETAAWVEPVAVVLAFGVLCIGLLAAGYEKVSALLGRFRTRWRKTR